MAFALGNNWPSFALLPLLLLGAVCVLRLARADVFTAMVDLENLLASESALTSDIIDQYIEAERTRLDQLSQFTKQYAKSLTEARQNANANRSRQRHHAQMEPTEAADEESVINPVNAYLLIKRLTRDWQRIRQLMNANPSDQFIKNITGIREANAVKYPDDEDLDGAALGLLRLQETYMLNTIDLANGLVDGESVAKELNSHDCFEIGRAAYKQKDYFYTLEWMQEALRRESPADLEAAILEYLAYALYQQGNLKRALNTTKRLAKLAPDHSRAAGNVKWYEKHMSAEELASLDELPEIQNVHKRRDDIPERDAFDRLCRGEFEISPANDSKLYCYFKRDKPYLKLAPHKVEIVHYEPLVVVFRKVISDEEIAIVKQLATPRLRRSTVRNLQKGYRVSKIAWLKDEEHPAIERINRRIHEMTNLDLESAEELQVANYGIGGHYFPHFDFAEHDGKTAYKGKGNRIATVLFYMSQPKKGGLTVFTDLETAVAPTIHDALFWYNLLRDGEGDSRTRHAACPVLTGIKWAANKWIHEKGQEFIRPCALKQGVDEQFVGETRPI